MPKSNSGSASNMADLHHKISFAPTRYGMSASPNTSRLSAKSKIQTGCLVFDKGPSFPLQIKSK